MTRFFLLLAGFALLILQSCSDKLTHSKAEKIIKDNIHFPIIEDVTVKYGFVEATVDSLPEFYNQLVQKGLFTVEHLGKCGELSFYCFRVNPTPEGRKYITIQDPNPDKRGDPKDYTYNSRFKTCEINFESIQTIHEYPALNGADVEYTAKRSNFTAFWDFYLNPDRGKKDAVISKTFAVIKNDNGWGPAKF